jgi:hypothetical protein
MITENNLAPDVLIDQTSAATIRCCPHKEQYLCSFLGDRAAVQLHKDQCLLNHQETELGLLFEQIREGSEESRTAATRSLHALLKPNPELRHLVVRLNGISALIFCLQCGAEESQYQANLCLDLLACDEDAKALLMASGLTTPLVSLIATAGIRVLPNTMLLLSKCVIFNYANQTAFGAAGVIPLLVRHVQSDVEDVQINAAGALWNIARKNLDNQLQIAALGSLLPLIRLALSGVTINAMGALWNIISVSDPDESLKISDPRILRLLLQVYKDPEGTTDHAHDGDGAAVGNELAQQVRTWIANALDTLLAINSKNVTCLVEVGALALITDVQPTDDDDLLKHTVSVLSRALKASPQCRAEINAPKLVPRLVTLLSRPLSAVAPPNRDMVHPSEGALHILRSLCDANVEVRDLFVEQSGLPKLMTLLAAAPSPDGADARTVEACQYEAMALLEYLTKIHAETSRELLCSVGLTILLAALDSHNSAVTLLAARTVRRIVDSIHNMCVQQPARTIAALLVRSNVWSIEPRSGVDVVVQTTRCAEVSEEVFEGAFEEVRERCYALLCTLAQSSEACRHFIRDAGVPGISVEDAYFNEGEG